MLENLSFKRRKQLFFVSLFVTDFLVALIVGAIFSLLFGLIGGIIMCVSIFGVLIYHHSKLKVKDHV